MTPDPGYTCKLTNRGGKEKQIPVKMGYFFNSSGFSSGLYRTVFVGAAVLLMIIFMPSGIFGGVERLIRGIKHKTRTKDILPASD